MKKELIAVDNAELRKALASFGLGDEVKPLSEQVNPFVISAENKNDIQKGLSADNKDSLNANNSILEQKENRETLIKGLIGEDTFNLLGSMPDLIKGINTQNDLLSKTLNTIATLKTENSNLSDRLNTLEKQPMPRKSVTSGYLEKGMGGAGVEGNESSQNNNSMVFSLSRDRKQIVNILEAKAEIDKIEKGLNNEIYTNALIGYESSNLLPQDIIADLNKQNIIITK